MHRGVLLGIVALAVWIPAHAQQGAAVPPADVPGAEKAAEEAQRIVAAMREALGGDAALRGIKSFTAAGRTRQVQGDNLVPIEFEIACELPDKCVRRDEIPARESGPTTIGFNGGELIQLPVPPPPAVAGRAGGPPPEAQRAARLATVRQDFARLMLGMFGAVLGETLDLAYAGEAEAPQGRADVIAVAGSNGALSGRLFVFRETRLPVMFTWTAPVQGKPAEHRLFYADYRDVDGVKLPFRLRRAVGAETTEETVFDRFRLNARIDSRRFEVRR